MSDQNQQSLFGTQEESARGAIGTKRKRAPESQLQAFDDVKLRSTQNQQMVIDGLKELQARSKVPPTANEIFDYLNSSGRRINLNTVRSTLDTLRKAKIVDNPVESKLADGEFEIIIRQNASPSSNKKMITWLLIA